MSHAFLSHCLRPEWPAPAWVRTLVTTRAGGISRERYASFNLGQHVGDEVAAVDHNRAMLGEQLQLEISWLEQVHGTKVVEAASEAPARGLCADAQWTRQRGLACAIMTADCLPVLLCDRAGTIVAAAHAGWRGLADGILEATVATMAAPPETLLAWLGPAIGPQAFEVGAEVRERFCVWNAASAQAFTPGEAPGKWWCDLFLLARLRLQQAGVTAVYGGGVCTYSDSQRFYSYRRDGVTGRFASLIWLSSHS